MNNYNLVVAFKYDKNVIDEVKNEYLKNNWKHKDFVENSELHEHIKDVHRNDSPNTICYHLYKEMKSASIGINNEDFFEVLSNDIMLFRTGIGFLMFEVTDLRNYDCDELLELITNLKATSRSNKHFSYKENVILDGNIRRSKKCDEEFKHPIIDFSGAKREKVYIDTSSFNLSYEIISGKIISNCRPTSIDLILECKRKDDFRDYINNLLKPVRQYAFFNSKKYGNGKSIPTRALLFNSVDITNMNDDVIDFTHKLARGFKRSYQTIRTVQTNKMFSFFDNSNWSFSVEGVSNTYSMTDNRATNEFFKINYQLRLKIYRELYLIVLHQYFCLLSILTEIASLPNEISVYITDIEEKHRLDKIYDFVNFVLLKCVYRDVSYVTHQNEFYRELFKRLGVDRLLNEVSDETDRMVNIINRIYSENEQRHWKKKEEQRRKEKIQKSKIERLYSIIAGIFVVITYYQSLLSIVSMLKQKPFIMKIMLKLDSSVFAFILLVLSVVLGFVLYKLFRFKEVDKS